MKIVGQFPIRDIELIIKKGEHRTHLKLPRKTKIYALRNGGILFYCNGCSILPKGKKTAEILEIRYKRFRVTKTIKKKNNLLKDNLWFSGRD